VNRISLINKIIKTTSFKLSLYYLFVIGSLKAIQFGATSFLAITLPVAEFGFFSMLNSYQVAAATFGSVGIVESLSGQLKNDDLSNVGSKVLFRKFTLILIILSFLTFLFLVIAIYFTNYKINNFYLYTISVLVGLIISFANIQSYFFRLDGSNFKSLISNSIISYLYYSIIILSAFYLDRIDILLSISASAVFAVFIILIISNYFYRPLILNISEIFFYLKIIFPYIIIGFFGWISGYGVNVFINELLGLKVVALFSFLLTISTLVQLVSSSLNIVWGPKFYKHFLNNDFDIAEKNNKQFYQLQILLLTILSVAILVIYKYISLSIPNIPYKNRILELCLLLISFIINIPWVHCSNYFFISNNGNKLMKNLLFTGIISIVMWVVFIHFFGEMGVFIGFVFNSSFKSIIIWIDSRNYWNVSNLWLEISSAVALTIFIALIISSNF
jgi:O-antigen/teichoic acid export membrane protein